MQRGRPKGEGSGAGIVRGTVARWFAALFFVGLPGAASSRASLADKFVNLTLAPRSHKSAESDGRSRRRRR